MLQRAKIIERSETKRNLVQAGISLMRKKGFNATTVDDICAAAEVTKGGFFHYFKSKNDVAKAALIQFFEDKTLEFAKAPFRRASDPLDRIFGRLEFHLESVGGAKNVTKGCLFGMLAQELAFTNPELGEVCREAFSKIALNFETDLRDAKELHAPSANFDPKSVAIFYVSVVQGSFLLSKVSGNNSVLEGNLNQFRNYLENLFEVTGSRKVSVQATA